MRKLKTKIIVGCVIAEGEKIEQIVNEVINILAQNKLNYDFSYYVLDETKKKLGEKSFIRD